MKIRTVLVSSILSAVLLISACGKSTTNPAPANSPSSTPKANSTNKVANNKPKTNTKLKPGEKPPNAPANSKTVPEGKKVAVPADWVTVYDQNRGYEFQVPENTKDDWQSVDEDIDVYLAVLPDPAKVMVMVVAYTDPDSEKDKILVKAKSVLEGMGEKDIKFSDTKEELNSDYYLVEFSSTDKGGAKTKGKLLVGIDKNDNFLMFVASPEEEYKNNEKVIDEVWSSFQMYSGGLSGNS